MNASVRWPVALKSGTVCGNQAVASVANSKGNPTSQSQSASTRTPRILPSENAPVIAMRSPFARLRLPSLLYHATPPALDRGQGGLHAVFVSGLHAHQGGVGWSASAVSATSTVRLLRQPLRQPPRQPLRQPPRPTHPVSGRAAAR